MAMEGLSWFCAAAAGQTKNGSMQFACWAMLIVLLAMTVVFLRSDKKDYAVAILPLPLVPFVYIVSKPLGKLIDPLSSMDSAMLQIMIVLTGGLLSCLLLGWAVRGIDSRSVRNVVFWGCAIFAVIVCLVLSADLLQAIVPR